MSSSQSPKSSTSEKSSQSQESVAIRFLNAVIDFMAKNSQSPSEIYQLLAQTGSVLLLQSEEFPKYMTRYIENKFEEADKEHTNNALNNFQAKYQIVVQLFNFATFLQNVRLPAILPFKSPVLSPEEQRKVEFKLEDAPLVKQYDFHHFQEISIATLETLLQSNRSPIQTSDYKEANNSTNKTKIPPHILSDVRFSLMAPKIEIQLASLYLQRSFNPFEVMKDMKNSLQQQFPPLYTHNHDKFYRSSNDDIALYYLKSALNVITPQNSPDDYAVAYSQMAHLLKQKKKYDEAIKAFQKVLEVRKVTDSDPTKYASLCMNIANTYLAKEEEAWSQFKAEYASMQKEDIVTKLFKEYSIILRESILSHQRSVSPSTANASQQQEKCEKFEEASKQWLKSIDLAIEWFGKSEQGFKQLKKPPSHEKKELSTQDQYIGLVSINLGYAYLLKTKLYMQIISNHHGLCVHSKQKKDMDTIKKAKTSAENAIVVLKTALEVIKPDVHEKDSILQKVRHMGSESFPKLNLYLAECYMYLYVCDQLCENSEDSKSSSGLLNLEEARTCLDLGGSLFMKKEMKDWRVRLNVLLFEVYFKLSHDEENISKEKKEQYLERSVNALKEAVKDKVQENDDIVTYDVDNFLNKYLESLSLND
ncbi:hypothetical protein FDP41_013095 [Naegleria fowleri]|uniref:Uncharacterized protein n=1 Tax=Naegleria fowleri TaxID=5763 RepID=A0A6A5C1G5_NAEFO|nr:uncharacterized protein FDP41_013095 [Naegleria fowleri]KAF0980612.1 hypothetical protein FDP41_013095 [Naegleria fowleri]